MLLLTTIESEKRRNTGQSCSFFIVSPNQPPQSAPKILGRLDYTLVVGSGLKMKGGIEFT
jgi:hypothetical protein